MFYFEIEVLKITFVINYFYYLFYLEEYFDK